jgi:hypothetical protein
MYYTDLTWYYNTELCRLLLLFITQAVSPQLSNFIACIFNKIVISIYPVRTIMCNSRSIEEISAETIATDMNC